ncbi:MAG: phosphatidylserine decarboxylase [Campylobacterales bacterium]|nr:phosphatidylserine decarboxylase [Campylobacterales bacterium]
MLSHFISKSFGRFAHKQFSPSFQNFINKTYVKIFDISLDEHAPIESYKSLNALFTRKLVKKRELKGDEHSLISPADCRVTNFGEIKNGQILQIKGKSYSLSELLNSNEKAASLEGGTFSNLYLSPKDYHRFHAPCDAKVLYALHIPGALYPVNDPALNSIDALFAKNERVVLCLEASFGVFYMVFVGALNVGKIVIDFDASIQTNAGEDRYAMYTYEDVTLKKGDEIGRFEMGSSIAMLFGKGQVSPLMSEGQKIRFADEAFRVL